MYAVIELVKLKKGDLTMTLTEWKRRRDEYREKEAAFAAAPGALCENVSPAECDCSKCPLREMCAWFDNNEDPHDLIGKITFADGETFRDCFRD